MAFYFPQGRVPDSAETNVAPGAQILAEGQALVCATKAPSQGVLPSTGSKANDIFVGFAVAGTSAAPFLEQYANKVENFVAPQTGAVKLAFTPVTGQVGVYNVTTSTFVASPTVKGQTVSGLNPGDEYKILYKHALSVVQARALYGDIQPGGYVGDYVGQIGLIKRGLIFTDQIDCSKDWSAVQVLIAGPNGQVVGWDGTGTQPDGAVINGYVVSEPSQEIPFLGIEFSAA